MAVERGKEKRGAGCRAGCAPTTATAVHPGACGVGGGGVGGGGSRRWQSAVAGVVAGARGRWGAAASTAESLKRLPVAAQRLKGPAATAAAAMPPSDAQRHPPTRRRLAGRDPPADCSAAAAATTAVAGRRGETPCEESRRGGGCSSPSPAPTRWAGLTAAGGGGLRPLSPDAWTRVCSRECVCGPLPAGPALFPDPSPAEAASAGGGKACRASSKCVNSFRGDPTSRHGLGEGERERHAGGSGKMENQSVGKSEQRWPVRAGSRDTRGGSQQRREAAAERLQSGSLLCQKAADRPLTNGSEGLTGPARWHLQSQRG